MYGLHQGFHLPVALLQLLTHQGCLSAGIHGAVGVILYTLRNLVDADRQLLYGARLLRGSLGQCL